VDLGPPDPVAQQWQKRVDEWSAQLEAHALDESFIENEAHELGLRPMPVRDQMDLQWTFVVAGLEQVALLG
jgi:hypothetical protein